jgi:pimeloyl-ACP methyl ester carboxylesterase
MGRVRKLVKRVLAVAAASIVALAVGAAGIQHYATARDLGRHPAPGTLVAVGGHRLHGLVEAAGTPAVVFDAPVGASSLSWALVQPHVAATTRTVVYDRAGYGWSDSGPRPRSSGRLVDELHDFLQNAQVPKPYVLVGASLGGCNVRLYAYRYPEEVAGLVLVDPAHEDQFIRSPSTRPDVKPLRLFQLASRLGIMRLAGMPIGIAGMNVLPPDLQAAAVAVGYRTSAVDAIVAETADAEAGFAEVRQARAAAGPTPLGDLPLIVLTRQDEIPPVGEEAGLYATWVELHRDLAAESTRGRQVMVEDSGHFIAVDQPAKVVEAIQDVVRLVRESHESVAPAPSR